MSTRHDAQTSDDQQIAAEVRQHLAGARRNLARVDAVLPRYANELRDLALALDHPAALRAVLQQHGTAAGGAISAAIVAAWLRVETAGAEEFLSAEAGD